MSFKKTAFNCFYDQCIKKYGEDEGKRIYDSADKRLLEMKRDADYRNSKIIKRHMDENILPAIAIYLAFIDMGLGKEEAYKNVFDMYQISARKFKKQNSILGRIWGGYNLFKLFCKSVISKDYPKEGWDIEWKQRDKYEIHFNMTRCIYMEMTQKYNCIELCPVFCAHDDTAFLGYRPNIIFQRAGTIGRGQKYCDFHFKNGRIKR